MSSRKLTKFSDISQAKPEELLLVSDEKQENVTIQGVRIKFSTFLNLGLKESSITNSSFTHSVFEDCYFRRSKLSNVDFTNTTFRNCNFDKSIFQLCDFRYCTFYNCKLPYKEIITNLPQEANLKNELAKNLKVNFNGIGDTKISDIFLDIEINAEEEELKAIFSGKTEYYKREYDGFERIKAFIKYVISKIFGFIWGYGHRITNLLISYILIMFGFSFAIYLFNVQFLIKGDNQPITLNIWDSIVLVFSDSINYYNIKYDSINTGKLLLFTVSFIGLVYLGMLAATLYRRIAR